MPLLLAASVLTVGAPSASAAALDDGYYSCISEVDVSSSPESGRYQVESGSVKASNCSAAVVIATGVTSIGISAFNSSHLTSITIPNTVTSIDAFAFYNTRSLTSVTIPNSVTSIGDQAFQNALSLASVTISNAVTNIGFATFSYTALTSITIPNSVTSIDTFAFSFARSLTSITIPNSVTSIGYAAFYADSSLTSITIPNSVTSIGAYAFSYATALTSISIPNGVTFIGQNAFAFTTSLSQYTYCGTSLTQTALDNAGLNGKTRISACSLAGLSSAFSSASSYDGRFTVRVTNYDSAFTYAVTSTVGQASINSTGLITVTGLRPDQSVTVTMTTSRTGYDTTTASVTGRSQVAPMLPTNKPVVAITDTAITCTIGSYSATPTSSAFSLFVDGKHVSTVFSALGEYLPDWIIPWATTSSITRTASLTSATWTLSEAYKGKSITCATLAYSKNAIGFTASQVMVAR